MGTDGIGGRALSPPGRHPQQTAPCFQLCLPTTLLFINQKTPNNFLPLGDTGGWMWGQLWSLLMTLWSEGAGISRMTHAALGTWTTPCQRLSWAADTDMRRGDPESLRPGQEPRKDRGFSGQWLRRGQRLKA